jgi:hypothetical protein
MAITRTHVTTLASVDVDDDGAVELTVAASRIDRTRVTITPAEARAFAGDLVAAADEADAFIAEQAQR